MFHFFKRPADGDEETTLKIEGMHCSSCSMNIDGTLEEIDGVIASSTSYATSKTKVKFNSSKTSIQKLREAIVALGYSFSDET